MDSSCARHAKLGSSLRFLVPSGFAKLAGGVGPCGLSLALLLAPISLSAQTLLRSGPRLERWVAESSPAAEDRKRLQEILDGKGSARDKAEELASMAGKSSGETRLYVYRWMARLYEEALARGVSPSAKVENALLATAGLSSPEEELLAVCNSLATAGLRLAFLDSCVAKLKPLKLTGSLVSSRYRLEGSLLWHRGAWAKAAPLLMQAALLYSAEEDSLLHLRLSQALRASGDAEQACTVARNLYLAAPLLPGTGEALAACAGSREAVNAALVNEAKQRLLATRLAADVAAPTLSLEDQKLQQVEFDAKKSGKITVLVFFSTWCPHCTAEIPRVLAFAHKLKANAKAAARVEILGIRTSVEREAEPYEAFVKRHGIDIPVLTDPVMSLAVTRFTKALGIAPSLPTIAVCDQQGSVRYLLAPGDYKDTAAELDWAVESLLGS